MSKKTITMKPINNKIALIICFFVSSIAINAQEVIPEAPVATTPRTNQNQKQKIDGVIATVGDLQFWIPILIKAIWKFQARVVL